MRRILGPQYRGDGVGQNGQVLTDVERGNAELHVTEIEIYNAGPVTIEIGDAVALVPGDVTFGLGPSGEQLDVSDAAFQLIIGGAVEKIPAGQTGMVRVEGMQEEVNVADAVVANALLSGGAVDGQLTTHASTTQLPAAIALTAGTAGNKATVRWLNPLRY